MAVLVVHHSLQCVCLHWICILLHQNMLLGLEKVLGYVFPVTRRSPCSSLEEKSRQQRSL